MGARQLSTQRHPITCCLYDVIHLFAGRNDKIVEFADVEEAALGREQLGCRVVRWVDVEPSFYFESRLFTPVCAIR